MWQRSILPFLFLSMLSGCSEPDEPLRGWEESDVEVIEAGETGDPARQVVAPGEAPLSTPMTATNLDTSTDLDMIDDENLVTESGTTSEDTNKLAGRIENDETTAPGATSGTRSQPSSDAITQKRPGQSDPNVNDTRPRQTKPASMSSSSTTESESQTETEQPAPVARPADEPEKESEPEKPAPSTDESEPPSTSTQPRSEPETTPPIIDETVTPADDTEHSAPADDDRE